MKPQFDIRVANGLMLKIADSLSPLLLPDTVFESRLLANGSAANLTELTMQDELDFTVNIRPDVAHQGQNAQLFVVAKWNALSFHRHNGVWKSWNGHVRNLLADQQ